MWGWHQESQPGCAAVTTSTGDDAAGVGVSHGAWGFRNGAMWCLWGGGWEIPLQGAQGGAATLELATSHRFHQPPSSIII